MELTKGMKIGIGVVVAAVGGFAIYKVVTSAKSPTGTSSTTTTKSGTSTTKKFDINSFLDGTWEAGYAFSNGVSGSDEFIFKGNDIYWVGGKGGKTTPEFTITSIKYDDKTGQLLMSYKRNSSNETWDDVLTIDKTKKTMTGTQNDGQIKLNYTKK